MVGSTLVELRDRIEALASGEGSYYVVCGRTGDRPIPLAGRRFADRDAARSAARTTAKYRSALRRYDPQLPCYDLIVCEATGPLDRTADVDRDPDAGWDPDADREADADRNPVPPEEWTLSGPVLDSDRGSGTCAHGNRVEFCHRLAAVVFESLSAGEYDGVESAVMAEYFDLAETVADPAELCLCLLECLADQLADRTGPREQADVFAGAAARLTPCRDTDEPVAAALRTVADRGLVGDFACTTATMDPLGGSRTVLARLSEYALAPRNDRLPVLPLVVELYRHQPTWSPTAVRVADADRGWRVTFELGPDSNDGSGALASVPIDSGA